MSTKAIKTYRMLELEKRYGKPIDELVVDAYNNYGFTGAFEFLNIARYTLARWLNALDIITFQGAMKREELEGFKRLGLKVQQRRGPTKSE